MAKRNWSEAKDKSDKGAFLRLPQSVLQSRAYLTAGPHARMLLIDLAMQYRGDNNGDLCAAWKIMQPRGWRSELTLQRAKVELIDLGLIVETRKGARPNKASLYAVTWCALDDCNGKLDISPRSFPHGAYRLRDPLPPIGKNASLTTPSEVAPTG